MGGCEFCFCRTCLYYNIEMCCGKIVNLVVCIMLWRFELAFYLLSLDKLRVYCFFFFFLG